MTWLIIDLGSSGAKVALVTPERQIEQSVTIPYPTHAADGGIVEQDAADWWRAVVEGCAALGAARSGVTAIAVTGQMQDAVLIDAAGEPTHPVILYSDTRAGAEADRTTEAIGADRLIALTGNEQGADSLRAKLRWLADHQPDALARADHLLFGAADYIVYRLTGMATCDTTTASTTGLLDLAQRTWLQPDVFAAMGIGGCIEKLPTLVKGGTFVKHLHPSAADALGLRAADPDALAQARGLLIGSADSPVFGLPVYHGPGDAGAATIGAGSGAIGPAYAYVGSSGWVAFTSETPGSPQHGVFTLAHPRPDRFIQIAPLLTAGGNLDWARGVLREAFPDVDAAIDDALARPPSSLLYLPYLNGERTPFRDPLARAAFIGLHAGAEPADLLRAVLEGVAYGYRHALDALLSSPPDRLILTGGGARSAAWGQLFADILGVPIAIARDAEHVGLIGALVAVSGPYAGYTPPDYPVIDRLLTPDPEQAARYGRKYAAYRAAYPALKDIFASLGE